MASPKPVERVVPHGREDGPLTIELSEAEAQLCTLLQECVANLKESEGINTSCRIAGGWVRDKLLGSESNDIDVALEDMMGEPFAQAFVRVAKQTKGVKAGVVHVVKGNPDQSKHLETAKTSIFGLDLDFVNLRSEEYVAESRIPSATRFGTPLEDALRRDITINTMFYNVHTREVEDHLGKGMDDLRNGIIRTPLAPRETFQDDPLRVLRCVRFAGRFGFTLTPEVRDAALDPEIQGVLVSKITRERVGEEVDKMVKGRSPLLSIRLLYDLGLLPAVFHLNAKISSCFSKPPASWGSSLATAAMLHDILPISDSLARSSLPALHPSLTPPSSSECARLFLAATLSPFFGLTYNDGRKKRTSTAVEIVIRDALKLGTKNHYMDGIPAFFKAAELIRDPTLDKFGGEEQRVNIGLLLRDPSVTNSAVGSTWILSTWLALALDLAPSYDISTHQIDVESASTVINTYNIFLSKIEELDLAVMAGAPPLLNGRDILSALSLSKPGPWTKTVIKQVIRWQLAHPIGTGEECVEWLKQERDAGRLDVPSASDDDRASKKAKR